MNLIQSNIKEYIKFFSFVLGFVVEFVEFITGSIMIGWTVWICSIYIYIYIYSEVKNS